MRCRICVVMKLTDPIFDNPNGCVVAAKMAALLLNHHLIYKARNLTRILLYDRKKIGGLL
jgi:hypothetical protein